MRLAAVWFRTEKGDQKLTSTQVANTLAGSSPHSADDDPVALLSSDHPGFDFSTLEVVLEVIQFRYRVEFRDPVTGDPIFELSMDKIVTTVPGQPSERTYGVELEVLQNGYLRRHTYTIYKVVLPDAEDTAEYLGDWVLRLTPRGNWDPRAVGTESSNSGRTLSFLHVNPTTGLVPIGFAAAVASNYRMQVEVLPTSYLPGAAVIVRASFVDKGWPAPAGRAMVDVTTPNGTLAETISLRDDGVQPDAVRGDGSFAGQAVATDEPFLDSSFDELHSLQFIVPATITEAHPTEYIVDKIRITKE